MDPGDHRLIAEEALRAQPEALPAGDTLDDALSRTLLLQQYLSSFEAQGLPVVRVQYGRFDDALDKLHEYVLACIKLAVSSA